MENIEQTLLEEAEKESNKENDSIRDLLRRSIVKHIQESPFTIANNSYADKQKSIKMVDQVAVAMLKEVATRPNVDVLRFMLELDKDERI